MSNRKIRFIVFLLIISIIGIFPFQIQPSHNAYDVNIENSSNQTEVDIIRTPKVADDLPPAEEWNRTWDSEGSDRGNEIAIDSSNNIYIVGDGDGYGVNQFDDDGFLVKYNSSGDKIWDSVWGYHPAQDLFQAIDTDHDDNVIIASSAQDFSLIKYTKDGEQEWNRTFSRYDWLIPLSVKITSTGKICVAANNISNEGMIFIFNSTGHHEWHFSIARHRYIEDSISLDEMVLDSSDNIYVVGTHLNPIRDEGAFFAKYNNLGQEQWFKNYDAFEKQDYGKSVAVDILGYTYGLLSRYETTTGFDAYMVKYDQDGDFVWDEIIDTNGYDTFTSINIDSQNKVLVAGKKNSQTCIIKYSVWADLIWEKTWVSANFNDIDVDSNDNIYIGGKKNDNMLLIKFDTNPPVLDILTPKTDELFGISGVNFTLDIDESNIDRTWYVVNSLYERDFSGMEGKIDQDVWKNCNDGNVDITFYVEDKTGYQANDLVRVIKDGTLPSILIINPQPNNFYPNATPSYEVDITDLRLNTTWYTLNGVKVNFTAMSGLINETVWNNFENGTVELIFYANDTAGNEANETIKIFKDAYSPKINITNPIANQTFSENAPTFKVNITELNLEDIWYTFDNGTTKFYCGKTGQIDVNVWKDLPTGKLRLRVYARDKAGNVAYDEVIIKKVIYIEFLPVGGDDGKKKSDEGTSTIQGPVSLLVINSAVTIVIITTSTIYFLKKKKKIIN